MASPTIDDFRRRPQVEMMKLSLDGSRVAYVGELNSENDMLVVDL